MKDLIKELRKIRRDKELSQEAVAAHCDIFRNHISQLETGRRMPNLRTLSKWADALGCEIVVRPKE
jgi:transcriptional regulator with XRE-family HTH domain